MMNNTEETGKYKDTVSMTETEYVLPYFSKDARFDVSGAIIRKPRIKAESFYAARRNVQAVVPVLRSVPKKLYR